MLRLNSGWLCSLGAVAVLLGTNAIAAENSLVAAGAQLVQLEGTYTFTEGPAVDLSGNVYFSDIMAEKIFKWSANDNSVSLHREKTGKSNGLAFDIKGNLIACEMDNNRVTRDDLKGNVTSIAEAYQGDKLHMLNDIWVAPNGGMYVSDFAGMGAAVKPGETMQVYYIPANSKGPTDIRRVTEDMSGPNGLIGTPDGKLLYAVDGKAVYSYVIGKDGALSNRKLFAQSPADGMALDEKGNVYLADRGIAIYSPEGKLLETIPLNDRATNLKFAGADRKTLFITVQKTVYTLKMNVRGAATAYELAQKKK
ncbi:MAG: SMP-30/gluconolactonase/LRE family protein [Steroidobacteraceae bacterium]